MERHSRLEALPEGLRMVAAIGVFDGVHVATGRSSAVSSRRRVGAMPDPSW